MDNLDDINPEFMYFIQAALRRGTAERKTTGGVVPFVVLDTDVEPSSHEFASERQADSLEQAAAFVRSTIPKPKMAVIVFDGDVEVAGQQQDVVIAECHLRDEKEGLIFGQRYRGAWNTTEITLMESPTYLGMTENLL